MGFLNTLTEIEQTELRVLASGNPLIMKLCNELRVYEGDSVKEFYSALKKGISKLTSQIHDGTLDADDPYSKSIVKLAESGGKIFDTLRRGCEESGGEKLEDVTKKRKSDNASIVDQIANKRSGNL